MTVLVIGQRDFPGVIDDVPALSHKLLAALGGPPPRARPRQLRLSRAGRRPGRHRAADYFAASWPRDHEQRARRRRATAPCRPSTWCSRSGSASRSSPSSPGVAGVIFDFHDDSPVHREVFGNIPDACMLAFYTVTPVLILAGALDLLAAGPNWERGAPDRRATTAEEHQAPPRATSAPASTCRRCCATPPPALMHSLIYFGFLVLLAVTTVLEIDHQLPEDLKFLHGDVYRGYAAGRRRWPGVVFLVGVAVGHLPPLHPAAVPDPHQVASPSTP